MEENDYIAYTATDLLNDDYFLESEHHPTQESTLFWAQLETEHPALAREMMQARSLLSAVVHSPGKEISQQEVKELWSKIESHTTAQQKQKKFKILFRQFAATAACIGLLFAGGWMVLSTLPKEERSTITLVKKPDIQPTDEIQLFLSDTKKLTVDGEDSKLQYKKGEVDINSQTIQIEKKEGADEEYNQLIVPAGKRSSITFQDGTKVLVNANTRVVYPVEFADKLREIYVEGEIYLEVAPDSNRPFIVKTNLLDVRVLGTKFNVNAYTESQSVVLVSGAVEVDAQQHAAKRLKPNERLTYSENKLQVQTVKAANYISWINGYYVFEKERVSTVVARLSQYYKKQIIVSSLLENITCSGKLNLRDNLEEVLETLAKTVPAQIEKTKDETYLIK